MSAWVTDIATEDEVRVLQAEYSVRVGEIEHVILPQRYPLALVRDLASEHEILSRLVGVFADGIPTGIREAYSAISGAEAATAMLAVEPPVRARVAVAALSYVRWANLVLHWQAKQTGTMSDSYNAVFAIRAVVPYVLDREFSADASIAAELLNGITWLSSKLGALKFQRVVGFLEKQFGPSGVGAHESLRTAIVRAATNLRTHAINPQTLGMTGEAARVGGTTLGQLLDRMDALTGVKTHADPNFKPFGPRGK